MLFSLFFVNTCSLNCMSRGEETIQFTESAQLLFSPCVRHRLFIIFPKEITIVDLEMRQAVGVIALDRSASPFRSLLPCTQRDILYCLHENGCVSVRVHQCLDLPRPQTTLSPVGGAESREVRYVAHGHSEPLRINKSCQVYAGALCPITEKEVDTWNIVCKITLKSFILRNSTKFSSLKILQYLLLSIVFPVRWRW